MEEREEYIPLELDVKSTLVTEDRDAYVIKLPNIDEFADGNYHVMTIDKSNVIKSGDGTMMTVYLRKDKDSVVRQVNKDGSIGKSYSIKNDKLIGFYMKNERKNNNTQAKAITKAIKPFDLLKYFTFVTYCCIMLSQT